MEEVIDNISPEEVKKATGKLKNEKTPGVDAQQNYIEAQMHGRRWNDATTQN